MNQDNLLKFVMEVDPVWRIVGGLVLAYVLKSLVDSWSRPKDAPPFYYETPYIPWLGSLVQFAELVIAVIENQDGTLGRLDLEIVECAVRCHIGLTHGWKPRAPAFKVVI